MITELKQKPYTRQFEKKEGDSRFVQLAEVNNLVNEINDELYLRPLPNQKIVTTTLTTDQLKTTVPLDGVEILSPVSGKYLYVKSITLRSDVSLKFLSINPDFLHFQGATEAMIDLDMLGTGKRFLKIIQPEIRYSSLATTVYFRPLVSGEGLYLFSYQGIEFTQGVGSLTIEIVYEEIDA